MRRAGFGTFAFTDEVAEQNDADDDADEYADKQHEGVEELLISFLYH